jgi:hypothetical protein
MKQFRTQPILPALLSVFLAASLLVACDEEQVVPPPPETVLASGVVMAMPLQTPLGGATVQLITNELLIDDPNYVAPCNCQGDLCSINTTSNPDGSWEMEVPVKYTETWAPLNMLMKVSSNVGPPQYNLFQPGGTNQGDLQQLASFFYSLFAITSDAGLPGLLGGQLAVFLGVAIGFADTSYPQVVATIPEVAVTAEGGAPEVEFSTVYLGEAGLPDPALTETSSLGVYYFSVPDASDAPVMIQLTGEKPGSSFVGGFYPACPGSSTGVAVIDPYYRP